MKTRRWALPYGCWSVVNGETVLFDRRYRPMFRRGNDRIVHFDDPERWVYGIVTTSYFYTDGTPLTIVGTRGGRILKAWYTAARTGEKTQISSLIRKADIVHSVEEYSMEQARSALRKAQRGLLPYSRAKISPT